MMSEKQFPGGLYQVWSINLADFSDFMCKVSTRQKLKYERVSVQHTLGVKRVLWASDG